MSAFSAGIGPLHVVRLVQWVIAIPLIWSFVVGILGIDALDPLMELAEGMGVSSFIARWVFAGASAALFVSEQQIDQWQDSFAQRLHDIIKTIGDEVREGKAVETAVALAASEGGGPAALFRDSLDVARDMPFESALVAVADNSGYPYFQEVAHLMAMAVDSPGDTGRALRDLGTELEQSYRLSSSLSAQIYASLVILQGTALVFVPFLFRLLEQSYYRNLAEIMDHRTALEPSLFFAYGAIATASLDGIVFDRWSSVPARIPVSLAMVYGGLNFM